MEIENNKRVNWTANFAKFVESYHTQDPEHLLVYIYAILYAPLYREKYADDLSYDYPRVPPLHQKRNA